MQPPERATLMLGNDGVLRASDLSPGLLELLQGMGLAAPHQVAQSPARRPRYLGAKDLRLRIPARLTELADLELWAIHDVALHAPHHPWPSRCLTASLMDVKRALASRVLRRCCLCAHHCGANRTSGQTGVCGSGITSRISRAFTNLGEERAISPSYSIYFSGCNWRCPYCQYPDELDPSVGAPVSPRQAALGIAQSTRFGTRTIHFLGGNPDQHLAAALAILDGTRAPLQVAWNSNGYASDVAMSLLHGIVDVYVTDLRYGNDDCAVHLGAGPGAWQTVTNNLLLAARQGADIIVRHLQLPGHFECCTAPCLHWLATNLRLNNVKVNLMNGQYFPAHLAYRIPGLDRPLPRAEHQQAVDLARHLQLSLVEPR